MWFRIKGSLALGWDDLTTPVLRIMCNSIYKRWMMSRGRILGYWIPFETVSFYLRCYFWIPFEMFPFSTWRLIMCFEPWRYEVFGRMERWIPLIIMLWVFKIYLSDLYACVEKFMSFLVQGIIRSPRGVSLWEHWPHSSSGLNL